MNVWLLFIFIVVFDYLGLNESERILDSLYFFYKCYYDLEVMVNCWVEVFYNVKVDNVSDRVLGLIVLLKDLFIIFS